MTQISLHVNYGFQEGVSFPNGFILLMETESFLMQRGKNGDKVAG
jgi:hypothetical protein